MHMRIQKKKFPRVVRLRENLFARGVGGSEAYFRLFHYVYLIKTFNFWTPFPTPSRSTHAMLFLENAFIHAVLLSNFLHANFPNLKSNFIYTIEFCNFK